jgi:hypothetical protein
MKHIFETIIIFALLTLVSCRDASTFFGRQPVARVGDKMLYAEEIAAVIPKGVSGADSLSYVESYIDKWVVRQLKLQEAELIFSSSATDIDKMVEEYRQSLLIRKIEQYYLDVEKLPEVKESEIEAYYAQHKNDFRLTTPVAKGFVVPIPEQARSRERIVAMMRSPKREAQSDFEQLCVQNNYRLVKFDEWVDYNEFLSHLPLLRSARHDNLLSNRAVQQIHHNHTYYYFKITDVINTGDPMPLFMAKDNIVRILTTRRQAEVIRLNEERMVGNAALSDNVKIWHREAAEE